MGPPPAFGGPRGPSNATRGGLRGPSTGVWGTTWALQRHERRAAWALHRRLGDRRGPRRLSIGVWEATWALQRHERRTMWALHRRMGDHVGLPTPREEGYVGPPPAFGGPRGPSNAMRGGPRRPSTITRRRGHVGLPTP